MAFYFDDVVGYKLVGKASESPKPKEEYDNDLKGLTKYWDKTATFTQKIKFIKSGKIKVHGAIEYQACIDGACTMESYNFSFESKKNLNYYKFDPWILYDQML